MPLRVWCNVCMKPGMTGVDPTLCTVLDCPYAYNDDDLHADVEKRVREFENDRAYRQQMADVNLPLWSDAIPWIASVLFLVLVFILAIIAVYHVLTY